MEARIRGGISGSSYMSPQLFSIGLSQKPYNQIVLSPSHLYPKWDWPTGEEIQC